MSFMYQVQKVSDNHYVLPKMGGMVTDVHAFLSEDLFAGTDEKLWSQAAASASTPGAIGMYLMPDTHLGYHLPVGGVLVTDDTILQAGSGYDISCGILHMKVPGLNASHVADWDKRRRWVTEVEKRISVGVGQGSAKNRDSKIEDILRYGAQAIGVNEDLCERQYIPVDENVDLTLIEKARAKAGPQLGSVGGGNHFIEMQVDRDTAEVWVMIHCGSRGFGWQAANHFFYEGARLRGLPTNRREESWLTLDEPLGRQYWAWHNAAANFAVANRWTIVNGIQEALSEVFDRTAVPFYEISHNLVQEETLILPDPFGGGLMAKRGFVHRKGATRAFPPGHPDLDGTVWEKTGHPCLIPGSMMAGAAILYPQVGAYNSGCSVNHGSGRVLGRGEAKRQLGSLQADIDAEMRDVTRTFGDAVTIRGIVGNQEKTPLDECGHVYKDLDAVLDVLEAENIARVAHRLYPVANIKGAD